MPATSPHPPGDSDLGRTYVFVIVVEFLVIAALYFVGRHFA